MHFLYGDRDPEQWLKENKGYLYRLEKLLIDGKGEALKQMRDSFPLLFNMPSVEDVVDAPDDEKVACACEDGDCTDCNGQNVKCKDCKYGVCKKDTEGTMPVKGVEVRVP